VPLIVLPMLVMMVMLMVTVMEVPMVAIRVIPRVRTEAVNDDSLMSVMQSQ